MLLCYDVASANRSAGGTTLVNIQPIKQRYNILSFIYVFTNKFQTKMKSQEQIVFIYVLVVKISQAAVHGCQSSTPV